MAADKSNSSKLDINMVIDSPHEHGNALVAYAAVSPPAQPKRMPRKKSDVASPPVMSDAASPLLSQVVVSETPSGLKLSHSPKNPATSARGRGRGRPQGSKNRKVLNSSGGLFGETATTDFRVHVLEVHVGEDIVRKIASLVQGGPRGICVLSANGNVSHVALSQPGTFGGVISYEGQFQILSLTGSLTASDEVGAGVKSRTGGFSVSFAGPLGQVIGGGIAGPLVAASPIKTIVGSFLPNAYKNYKQEQQSKAKMVYPIQSVSHVQNNVGANDSINGVGPHSAEWNSAEEPSPDINMAAPDE